MSADLGLARVQRDTVQERIYAALRDKLMRGAFEPGQGLKLAELSKAFGTSAMPVRTALNRLTAERALEDLPNRTVRVPALTVSQLQDLKDARCAVEGIAVARATQLMTGDTLRMLERSIEDQDRFDTEKRPAESAEQNQFFHFTIYRQAGSPVLLAIIESLWLQSGPYLRAASSRLDCLRMRSVEFHSVIVEALRSSDAVAARKGLEADIERSFALVMETLKAGNMGVRARG